MQGNAKPLFFRKSQPTGHLQPYFFENKDTTVVLPLLHSTELLFSFLHCKMYIKQNM